MTRLVEVKTDEQLKSVLDLYLEAFPPLERKPMTMIIEKVKEGHMELLALEDEQGTFQGLAITIMHSDIVLLDYFAVHGKERGNGLGSKGIQQLLQRYKGKRFILEIESTTIEIIETKELELRKRRKAFYQRNGLQTLPYQITLFGIQMEMMTSGAYVSFEEYHSIFEILFDKEISENICYIKTH